jgi:hypothetical protein
MLLCCLLLLYLLQVPVMLLMLHCLLFGWAAGHQQLAPQLCCSDPLL